MGKYSRVGATMTMESEKESEEIKESGRKTVGREKKAIREMFASKRSKCIKNVIIHHYPMAFYSGNFGSEAKEKEKGPTSDNVKLDEW